jgi:hypothetical protein
MLQKKKSKIPFKDGRTLGGKADDSAIYIKIEKSVYHGN